MPFKTFIMQYYQMKVIRIFWQINWLGLTIQEMLKEEDYAFFLKSPYLPSNLDEWLLCELNYKNKTCFIATLHRSSSQSREKFVD